MFLYVLGYNHDATKPGIRVYNTDWELEGECRKVENPSYGEIYELADGRRVIYAACELEDRAEISALRLDNAGIPYHLGTCGFGGASGTCFVLVNPGEDCIYGADYNSGSICSCKLKDSGAFAAAWPLVQHFGHGPERSPEDPNRDRQLTPHIHTLSFVPNSRFMAAVDLGLDKIFIYKPYSDGKIDEESLISEVEVPAGCGPRIVAYHPRLRIACVVCELSCEAMIFSLGENGAFWSLLERHGLVNGHSFDWENPDMRAGVPDDEYPPLAAHAEFSRDGRFLYVSTRGTDTITIFAIDDEGHATEIDTVSCGGRGPRHFAISPDQKMLAVANQFSDEVVVFERDKETGALTEIARIDNPEPSCIIWN